MPVPRDRSYADRAVVRQPADEAREKPDVQEEADEDVEVVGAEDGVVDGGIGIVVRLEPVEVTGERPDQGARCPRAASRRRASGGRSRSRRGPSRAHPRSRGGEGAPRSRSATPPAWPPPVSPPPGSTPPCSA